MRIIAGIAMCVFMLVVVACDTNLAVPQAEVRSGATQSPECDLDHAVIEMLNIRHDGNYEIVPGGDDDLRIWLFEDTLIYEELPDHSGFRQNSQASSLGVGKRIDYCWKRATNDCGREVRIPEEIWVWQLDTNIVVNANSSPCGDGFCPFDVID